MLPQHRTQCRLSQHVGSGKVRLNLDNRAFGIDHAEIEHRSTFIETLSREITSWRRYFDDLDPQIDAHHLLDEGN